MIFRHNSTIGLKNKKCRICGRSDQPWFSDKRCAQCAKVEDVNKRMEAATEQMIRDEDLGDLIKTADDWVSRYVRLFYSNEAGMCSCYTCGVVKHWTLLEAGHFAKRGHLYLRWDVSRNLRPQCPSCNHDQNTDGQRAIYRQKLNDEKNGLPEILDEEALLVYKPTREEIRQIIAEYKPKVNALKKKINPQNI